MDRFEWSLWVPGSAPEELAVGIRVDELSSSSSEERSCRRSRQVPAATAGSVASLPANDEARMASSLEEKGVENRREAYPLDALATRSPRGGRDDCMDEEEVSPKGPETVEVAVVNIQRDVPTLDESGTSPQEHNNFARQNTTGNGVVDPNLPRRIIRPAEVARAALDDIDLESFQLSPSPSDATLSATQKDTHVARRRAPTLPPMKFPGPQRFGRTNIPISYGNSREQKRQCFEDPQMWWSLNQVTSDQPADSEIPEGEVFEGPAVTQELLGISKVDKMINHLRCMVARSEEVAHVVTFPAVTAKLVSFRFLKIPEQIQKLYVSQGRKALYRHQAEAIKKIKSGASVVVATPTASGKSTCYTIPILEMLLSPSKSVRNGRALLIFPLKALAQDQLEKLRLLVRDARYPIRIECYDGDTPVEDRIEIRQKANVILTNPDMLHHAILPYHTLWGHFLQSLRFVVIDESHTYRGLFGSHVACILRRLRGLCRYYQSSPQYILCSATIANPGEHAKRLTGVEVIVVGNELDGAPKGKRTFIMWNPCPSPPGDLDEYDNGHHMLSQEAQQEAQPYTAAAKRLLVELVKGSLRSVAFVRSRTGVELLTKYVLNRLGESYRDKIEPYRAGYSPEERRRIERALMQGDLLAVVTTSALELGIDIGGLDVTLIVGFPGSIASFWQQAGRSGRGTQSSLTIFVGSNSVVDQYYMKHPMELLSKKFEAASLNPDNPIILSSHLLCAAKELPLSDAAVRDIYGDQAVEILSELENTKQLSRLSSSGVQGRILELPADVEDPARQVAIRNAGRDKITIVERSGSVVDEVDMAQAGQRVHKGAVYLHQGVSYLINRVDFDARKAFCVKPSNISFFTVAQTSAALSEAQPQSCRLVRGVRIKYGRVKVSHRVEVYEKRQFFSETKVGERFKVDFPPYEFVTDAAWFEIPSTTIDEVTYKYGFRLSPLFAVESLRVLCHAVVPICCLCDPSDVGSSLNVNERELQEGIAENREYEVYLYDALPGGCGIAEQIYNLMEDLWRRALLVVSECKCKEGCPSCVMGADSWSQMCCKPGAKAYLQCFLDRNTKVS